MRTVTLIIITGLLLMFLGSLYLGSKEFSPYERRLDGQLTHAKYLPPKAAQATLKIAEYKKVRLAFRSFDLVGGLTVQDLDVLTEPCYRALSFFFLFACLWVIFGLKIIRH